MKRKPTEEDLEREVERQKYLTRMEAARQADAEHVRDRNGTESTPIPAVPWCHVCGEQKHGGLCRCDKVGSGRIGWPERHLPWG